MASHVPRVPRSSALALWSPFSKHTTSAKTKFLPKMNGERSTNASLVHGVTSGTEIKLLIWMVQLAKRACLQACISSLRALALPHKYPKYAVVQTGPKREALDWNLLRSNSTNARALPTGRKCHFYIHIYKRYIFPYRIHIPSSKELQWNHLCPHYGSTLITDSL
jgi:hypothetical protein